jgi:putative spermidine/putrescine transport system substrate-binding protein/mannopine transport system substrate-binding protein
VLATALLADGVEPAELVPMDLDRAFRKMDEIKPEVAVWWETGDQSQQIMRDREVVLSMMWSGRAVSLKDEGVPIDVELNQAIDETSFWSVLKDAPHLDAAYEFLNFYITRPEAHVEFYEDTYYPTPNQEALDLLPESERQDNVATIADELVEVNGYEWVAENQERITERWNSWLAG